MRPAVPQTPPVAPPPPEHMPAQPVAPAPAVSSPVQAAGDPLFEPVTEADPIAPAPTVVPPTPTMVAPDVAERQNDTAAPLTAPTGQTVIANSKPHKSRRKTMLILFLGLVVLAAIGFAAYSLYLKPNVTKVDTPSVISSIDQMSPTGLKQATDKGTLEAGSQTNSKSLLLSASKPSDAPSGTKLQVEVQPLGTDFTGTPLTDTVAVPDSSDSMKVTLTNYAAGSYHWRARLSDGTTQGPWVNFAADDQDAKTADFTIDRTAPAAAELKTLNGKTVATKTFTSRTAQPVFTGTAEAGTTITITFKEGVTASTTTGADGTWKITASAVLPNAKYSMTIATADAAGNSVDTAYTLTQSAN